MKGFTYLFACLILAGGAAAFAKKGSSKSLAVSAATTALLLGAASLMAGGTYRVGTVLALGERKELFSCFPVFWYLLVIRTVRIFMYSRHLLLQRLAWLWRA
jgi:hypothetical protein